MGQADLLKLTQNAKTDPSFRTQMVTLESMYTLSVGVTALSSSDTNALPILWMMPCLLIIGHKLRGWYGVYAQSDSPGGSSGGEVMKSIRLFCWC